MESEEWSWYFGLWMGLRDSVAGIAALWRAPRELSSASTDDGKRDGSREKPMSTLERRRQQKRQESVKDTLAVKRQEGQSVVIHRVVQCMLLNGGVVWLSIITFNHVLTPILKLFISFIYDQTSKVDEESASIKIWEWAWPFLSFTFNSLWIFPIFLLSRVINAIWFQDIADASYRLTRGRPMQLPSLSRNLADILFSLVVETFFLVQAFVMKTLIPIPPLADFFYFLHLCLLYALYSFEYKWFNMGWDVTKRLAAVESSWPYYFGFGIPLAFCSGGVFFPVSFVVSGCIFSVMFPLFIISANHNQVPAASGVPLRLFSASVTATDKIFSWKRKSPAATSK